MSASVIQRMAEVAEAMLDPSAAPQLELITRQIRAFGVSETRVADALAEFWAADSAAPQLGYRPFAPFGHPVVRLLVTAGAAVAGFMGLSKMTALFSLSEPMAILPLLAIGPALLGLVLHWVSAAKQRRAEKKQRLAALCRCLCAAGLSGMVALDLASHIFNLSSEEGQAMLEVDSTQVAVSLAIRAPDVPQRKRSWVSPALMILGLGWVVLTFWGLYFQALGSGILTLLTGEP